MDDKKGHEKVQQIRFLAIVYETKPFQQNVI